MTIDVSDKLESRLRDLAERQGRDLSTVVEDALHRYLDDAAITDLTPAEVAATQEKLLGELTDLTSA
jgi:predicted transcriptional regulator